MSNGIHKKLARARDVCMGAGFILAKLEAQYGADFSEGMRLQVKAAINECNQQASATFSLLAPNAVAAERMHEKRAKNMGKAS